MSAILYLTTIEFGAGSIARLPEMLPAAGITRPLLISDNGLAASGLLERVAALLPSDAPHFLDVPANPTESAVRAAAEAYLSAGADGLVAVGGGSPIDLAKGVALMATHPGPLEQYAAIGGGTARIHPSVAPVVAVPTTAGTGAEVGRAALLIKRFWRLSRSREQADSARWTHAIVHHVRCECRVRLARRRCSRDYTLPHSAQPSPQ